MGVGGALHPITERLTLLAGLGRGGTGVVRKHNRGGANLLSDQGDQVAGRSTVFVAVRFILGRDAPNQLDTITGHQMLTFPRGVLLRIPAPAFQAERRGFETRLPLLVDEFGSAKRDHLE